MWPHCSLVEHGFIRRSQKLYFLWLTEKLSSARRTMSNYPQIIEQCNEKEVGAIQFKAPKLNWGCANQSPRSLSLLQWEQWLHITSLLPPASSLEFDIFIPTFLGLLHTSVNRAYRLVSRYLWTRNDNWQCYSSTKVIVNVGNIFGHTFSQSHFSRMEHMAWRQPDLQPNWPLRELRAIHRPASL